MSVVAIVTIPGMTEADYRAVRQALGEDLQPGILVHLAGPVEGGWQVIEVWDSPDAMHAFFQSPRVVSVFREANMPPVTPVVTPVSTLAVSLSRAE